MKRKELIKKYIEYFRSSGHKQILNASLIPENDPTVLFTTAGMHPLVPYLSGQKHPEGNKLVNIQKCIRTGDIENVGDKTHHTFFEMLGNWSLGDYWKEDSIKFSFEFLTKELNLDKEKLAVSVFEGDDNAKKDSESAKIWEELGIPKERIAYLGKKDNWWGPAGKTGPCGPDTEMFYWTGEDNAPEKFDSKDENWVEIWNDVLMQYNKDKNKKYNEAKQKNIDTGMGLERTLAVLNNISDNYTTEIWLPIIEEIEHLSSKNYEDYKREMRIIADHIKASVMILAEKITPSNTEQGYVLRRLIRRAIMNLRKLGFTGTDLINPIAEKVFEIYDDYEHLQNNRKFIHDEINAEEEKFDKTLEKGLKLFEKITKDKKEISGKNAFLLFQSYGFPLEMTVELAKEKNISVDIKGYKEELSRHQELSRTATAGKFKSGLSDDSKATTRLHTATHLLLAAMNKILDIPKGKSEIEQKGSNITAERARFDFSYDRKLNEEEVKEIESMVNKWIEEGHDVNRKEMTLDEARDYGAAGIFEDKYKNIDKLSVFTIGNVSKEICTGPHVKSLTELQGYKFKIKKQKSVGAGARRVKVVLEKI